jgi:hypothetical protein
MTKEQLIKATALNQRIAFYTKFLKVLKATGATNIDFTELKDDMEELEVLREMLSNIFDERKAKAESEFETI